MEAVQYYGTGRRKTSTARVFLRPGTGAISVNHREFEAFFPTEALRTQIKRPLVITENIEKFDILATVEGGGVSGQAGCARSRRCVGPTRDSIACSISRFQPSANSHSATTNIGPTSRPTTSSTKAGLRPS